MEKQDQIRERITAKLEEHGLAVRGASIAAGLGETTLRNFMKGMTASFTVATAEKLAPILHVSTRWLLTGEEGDEAEVLSVFSRIPRSQRTQALAVLRAFTGGDR